MTVPDGWQLVPVERSYDMRAHAILAFNSCKGDRDGALQAAWEATLRHSYAPAPSADNALPADSDEPPHLTIGDAAKSVGAWQDNDDVSGYVHFGSWMAVHAFVQKMQAPLLAALRDVGYSKPVTASPAQMLNFVQGVAKDALAAQPADSAAAPAAIQQFPGVSLPVGQMSGAPWNILDKTGARVIICGSIEPGNTEWDTNPELAAALVEMINCAGKALAEDTPAQADHSAQAQGECDDCQDTGQVCVGISGQAEDGNAPVFERCPSCGYGDEAQAQADTPEFMCERLRATKLRFCAEAADMIEKLAAQAQAGEVALPERVKELIETHGSLRSAARALEIDAGYLHRLGSGEKQNPDDGLLEKMGLRRVIYFERAVRALAAGAGMQGQDAKDAARYRWLRDCVIPDEAQEWICAGKFDDFGVDGLKGQELDAAIDKAVYATREAGK
jgi:hypothetical protein